MGRGKSVRQRKRGRKKGRNRERYGEDGDIYAYTYTERTVLKETVVGKSICCGPKICHT